MRRAPHLLLTLAASLMLVSTADAGTVPINPFGRAGDLHVDFPTFTAAQSGGIDNPPDAMLHDVGDVNADGRDDLAMAISSPDPVWSTAVWVTFTPASLPVTLNAGDPAWNGLKIVDAGEQISGIAAAGDVNGDGFGDVAISSSGGGAWVVFGGATPTTVDVKELGDRGFSITGLHACWAPYSGNVYTGLFARTSSVLGVGDQNGDGRPDLAICDAAGIRVVDTPASPAGAVIDATQLGAGGATLTPPADISGALALDTLGDTDGDGRSDVIVGWNDLSGTAHVLATPLPSAGSSVAVTDAASSPRAWSLTAANEGLERFGAIGDDNGDGRRDLTLSLVDAQAGRRQMVVYGQPPGTHAALLPLEDSIGHAIDDRGSGVTDVGDQDSDGHSDLAYDDSIRLSGLGQYVSIDAALPQCVTLKKLSENGSLVLCSLEYKIAAALPDMNGDGKPELAAIHADPLPVEDGITRATWRLDVFLSAPFPVAETLDPPIILPGGGVNFSAAFLTSPTAPSRTLAARPAVVVSDGAGHTATATGALVDAGATATTRATVQATAASLGLVPGRTYTYRMSLENGRGLTGVTVARTFAYPAGIRPSLSRLRLSPATFRAARSGASSARAKMGTRIAYRATAAGTTTFTVERATRAHRFAPLRGHFTHHDRAGANALRFRGRVGGRTLRPGIYRLTATPESATGARGRTLRASFRIVR